MKYTKFITFNVILISLIVIIAAGLLIWNRIDVEPHLSAVDIETGSLVERGEIMTTTDEYAAFKVGGSIVYLSENTELKLVDGREEQVDLQLIQGRIVLEGDSNVSIREIDVSTQGVVSIVHYSWLDQIEVATIENQTSIKFDDQMITLENESILMSTLAPYTTEYIEFDPKESSEVEFYDWVSNFPQE